MVAYKLVFTLQNCLPNCQVSKNQDQTFTTCISSFNTSATCSGGDWVTHHGHTMGKRQSDTNPSCVLPKSAPRHNV